jgi:hypothetical protein
MDAALLIRRGATRLWTQAPTRAWIEAESDSAQRTPSALHQYRVGYQTVGQHWFLWPKGNALVEAEGYEVRPAARYLWATSLTLSNGLWIFGGSKNPTEWDEPYRSAPNAPNPLFFWRTSLSIAPNWTSAPSGRWDFSEDPRSTGTNQDILFFWRTQIPATPTSGNFTLGALSLILVSDEPIRPPNDYSGSLFFWRTPTPVIVQTPDLVQGQVPGWVPGGRPPKKPRGNKGLGPVMREGQVFGESYPPSPFILQPGEKAQLAPSPGMQQDLFIASPEEVHAAILALMAELL